MRLDRVFLDTAYIQGLLSERDQYHAIAQALFPHIRSAREVWVTEAVLTEVGNALSSSHRTLAVRFIRLCYQTANIRVVSVDANLLQKALHLYERHQDKTWGLTDCISFVVMAEKGLTDAATADHHFTQAGYRALLLNGDWTR